MAPRRGTRVVKVERSIDYDNLTVKEVLCPICRSILIEPVTLPCSHVFCSSCFQGTMENANLVCPLCRLRIGSWLRLCKKENKLINVDYWNAIKRLFPEQIKNKLEGVEDNLNYEDTLIQLAKPGELKKEYETQMRNETETLRKEREAESRASEALIKELREQEEFQRMVEEEKLRMDEEIARKLAEEFKAERQNNKEVSSSQLKLSNNNNNPRKSGPLDRFLKNKSMKNGAVQSIPPKQEDEKKIDYAKKDYTCRILCHDIGNDCEMKTKKAVGPSTLSKLNQQITLELQQALDMGDQSDSGDSIEAECRYFKPVDYRHSIPCQRIVPIRVPAVRREVKTNHVNVPKGPNTLGNDVFNTAFAAFSKLSLEENANEKTKSESLRQVSRGKKAVSENIAKKTPEKSKSIKNNISPEKKKSNNTNPLIDFKEIQSTPKKVNQNKSETEDKMTSSVKRKISKNSPNFLSPSKKSKANLNNSFSRFLETPTSPFRGFCRTELEEKTVYRRITRNNKLDDANVKNCVDPDKIKLQVKSDYELAKKLQDQFNSSSYSTRSSAPRRGTKVTRQVTLDCMLSNKSKIKH